MAVYGGGGDNRMGALEVCTVFRIKVMSNNVKHGSGRADGSGKIYVCQGAGQYTPVVLMLGRYRGELDEKSLQERFYVVEHGPEYLNVHDEPRAGPVAEGG